MFERLVKSVYSGIESRPLAWFLVIHGIVNINMSWITLLMGLWPAALFGSFIGNLVTWTGYYELERRKRDD